MMLQNLTSTLLRQLFFFFFFFFFFLFVCFVLTVLADNGYDGPAADTWSCGVILYVLMAGFLPFDEPTMSALFRKIGKADFSYPTW